ncbi:MAG: hypothetical protein AAGG44_06910, partial [Planctomycetota bacterium]
MTTSQPEASEHLTDELSSDPPQYPKGKAGNAFGLFAMRLMLVYPIVFMLPFPLTLLSYFD